MQVVGSGFGRTGTQSKKRALEILGFGPCHHMEEVVRHPTEAREWVRIAQGGAADWTSLMARYGSCVDFPASTVWKELIEAFPDAKVLHTVRDPDRWYDSTRSTIYRSSEFITGWLRTFTPAGYPVEIADRMVWDGLFDGRFEDRDHAIAVYENWTADVIASVPAERLLVFDVAEGWEPLCAFLDVPVPDQPFPRVNDRETMLRRMHGARWAGRVLPVAAILAAGYAARPAVRAAQRRFGTSTSTASSVIAPIRAPWPSAAGSIRPSPGSTRPSGSGRRSSASGTRSPGRA